MGDLSAPNFTTHVLKIGALGELLFAHCRFFVKQDNISQTRLSEYIFVFVTQLYCVAVLFIFF